MKIVGIALIVTATYVALMDEPWAWVAALLIVMAVGLFVLDHIRDEN